MKQYNIYNMARNKYIYIVVKKWFYLSKGIDTAGCISNDDIHSFGTLKSAKELKNEEDKLIALIHYPPFNVKREDTLK